MAAAVLLVGWLGHTASRSTVPFDEDEAAHGNAALAVWQALHAESPRGAIAAVVGQGYYPPLHSLVLVASYAVGGVTLAASRVPSAVLFAVALAAVAVAAGRCVVRLEPGWRGTTRLSPPAAWSVALVAVATSPIVAEHAVLCMLELLAVAGGSMTLVVLASAIERDGTRGSCDGCPERARWLVAGGLVALLGVGVKYSFGVIEVIALGVASIATWRKGSLEARGATAVCALAPPLVAFGAWLAVTSRSEVSYFFFGHPSYAPMLSAQNLTFYPRAWMQSYFVSPLVSVVVFALAVIGALVGWRSAAVRFATGTIGVSWAMLTASTTNEARHGILMVPSASLLASVGLAWLARQRPLRNELVAGIGAIGFELVVAASAVGWVVTLPASIRVALEGLPEYDAIEAFVSRRVDPATPILANGAFDQLGVDGLRWRLGRDHGERGDVESIRIARYPVDVGAATMAARRGFGVDPLWADPELARQPFEVVARSGRFRHVVQIVDRVGELPNPAWSEVASTCRRARVGRLDLGRWTVVVADLTLLPKADGS